MNRDPWVVLGLQRTAKDEEIKERYRQLARQLHPDRNPGDSEAAQKFQDVSWAYDALRSEENRMRWQAENESPLQVGQRVEGGELEVSFLEAFRGDGREVRVESEEICSHCAGSGASPGSSPRRCSRCSGSGQIALGGISQPCQACSGRGYVIPQPCQYCSWGRIRSSRNVLVHVPPGVVDGEELLVADGPREFLFRVSVEASPIFERSLPDPADLLMMVPVSFPEALLGAPVRIPTPDRVVELQVPPGSSSGRTLRIQGAGMPRREGSRGDLYARIEIDVPPDPSPSLRRLAEKIKEEETGELRSRLFQF